MIFDNIEAKKLQQVRTTPLCSSLSYGGKSHIHVVLGSNHTSFFSGVAILWREFADTCVVEGSIHTNFVISLVIQYDFHAVHVRMQIKYYVMLYIYV